MILCGQFDQNKNQSIEFGKFIVLLYVINIVGFAVDQPKDFYVFFTLIYSLQNFLCN